MFPEILGGGGNCVLGSGPRELVWKGGGKGDGEASFARWTGIPSLLRLTASDNHLPAG